MSDTRDLVVADDAAPFDGDRMQQDRPEPTPLLVPAGHVAGPITDRAELESWAADLATADGGPVALDAERASGFRYGSRAYLVQLRRRDLGTALFDPIALGDLSTLDEPLSRS